ncbi:MAG: hypothetical protein MZV64_14470 [Ignavibacteriales bacterium]|nr:hypothetical protein [Ignavibacteriales bacterium]
MAKNGSTSTRREFIKAAGWGAAAASLAPLGAAGDGPVRADSREGGRIQAQLRPRHRRFRGTRREEPGRPAHVHRRPGLHGLVRQRPDGPARGRTGEAGRGIGAAGTHHRPLRRLRRFRRRVLRHQGQGRQRHARRALQNGRRDGEAHGLPVDAGRPGTLQPEARLGLPDGQRRREPQKGGRHLRARGPRHRARAPQSQGPPRALPDQDGPGLPDLQGRREPLGQDPRRHVPPADHRGEHHPQHRRLLGRAGLVPHRRHRRAGRSRGRAR